MERFNKHIKVLSERIAESHSWFQVISQQEYLNSAKHIMYK